MARVVIAHLTQAMLLLLLVTVATFALLRLTPGDPGALLYGLNASPQDLAQLRARWGLDAPILVQYLVWVANALGGDLGRSYADGRPVLAVVSERLAATLLLAGIALAIATVSGVSLGALSASRRGSRVDRGVTLLATILYSTPTFWLGILAILLFSLSLGWLPSGGLRSPGAAIAPEDLLRHLVLPALVLSLRDVGRFARVTRSALLAVMAEDYLRTATAKGLGRRTILVRHALRNALLPMLALLGMSLPGLLSGAVVVETVFAWPGLGRLAIESALQRNYPVILAEVLIVAVLAVAGSLLADLACAIANPRVRRSGRGSRQ